MKKYGNFAAILIVLALLVFAAYLGVSKKPYTAPTETAETSKTPETGTAGTVTESAASDVGVRVTPPMSSPKMSPDIPDNSDVPETSPEHEATAIFIDYLLEGGRLELPVCGASGYASVSVNLRETPDTNANIILTLDAGQGFTILEESGDWWLISASGEKGWVMHRCCLINLPDVVPSIIYNNTNAFSSIMRSSGREIPGVTGQALYETYAYNKRFGENMYTVPVLYAMAIKICAAQQAALAEGSALIIYEAFRPYDVQRKIVKNLTALTAADPEVKAGVTKEPWTMGWFIATGLSNHQRGAAIDTSLGKIITLEKKTAGGYIYNSVKEYTEYSMPSMMHELSAVSVVFASPVSAASDTEWRSVEPADKMNKEALLLQRYCADAGLTPLSSEWWHFNDLECVAAANQSGARGNYYIQVNYSSEPFSGSPD